MPDTRLDAPPAMPADTIIPLLQETVRVDKRTVENRTRVHVTVSEHEEAVEAMLLRQDVSIERIAVGRTVQEAPPTRWEGDTIVIPVMEEILVVEKRLVLKEELRIRIDQTRHAETQVIHLRQEHAEIQRDGTADADPNPGEKQ